MKRYEDDGAEFLRTVLDGLRDKKHACEPCGSATDAWSFFWYLDVYWKCIQYKCILYNRYIIIYIHTFYSIIYIYIPECIYIYIGAIVSQFPHDMPSPGRTGCGQRSDGHEATQPTKFQWFVITCPVS